MPTPRLKNNLIEEIDFLLERLTSLGSPVGPLVGRERLFDWDYNHLKGLIFKLKRMIVILAGPDGLKEEFLYPSVWLVRVDQDVFWPDGRP